MKMRFAVVFAALALVGAGCASGSVPQPTSVVPVDASGTQPTAEVPAAVVTQPPAPVDAQHMIATLHTTKGEVVLEFFPDLAPHAVENFIKLAKSGFYDGVKFHRVIKGFMIQGGDPLSKDDKLVDRWGTGGPGYAFDDEIGPDSKNDVGTLAMANSGPNTNGSQFFINAKHNAFLNGSYVVFGRVIKGMEVVTAIETTPTGPNDRPKTPMVIEKVTVEAKWQ
jgi:cyclophilin family peptidyl-prolyl cis-trans isomerase